jgi:hypothetical protein
VSGGAVGVLRSGRGFALARNDSRLTTLRKSIVAVRSVNPVQAGVKNHVKMLAAQYLGFRSPGATLAF